MLAALAILICRPGARAQNRTSAPAPAKPSATNSIPSNRFLFVVETSTAMKKYSADVDKAVESIIRNSASGQLHRGDTLGFWTFNTNLYTGMYALQNWVPDNIDEIALMTKEFLRQQAYVKGSRLDLAVSGLMEVVKRSDIITVFLISPGEGKIQGTPFDEDLNALRKQILADNKGSHMPVVTVLQGKGGNLFRYTANMLPWPVVIPEVPIAVKLPAAAPDSKPVQTAQAQSAPAAPANPVQQPPPASATVPAVNPALQVNAPPPANQLPVAANLPPATSVPKVVTPATAPPEAQPAAQRASMLPHPVNAPLSAAPGPPLSQPDAIAASETPVNANPPIRQAPTPAAPKPAVTPAAQSNASSPLAAVNTNAASARVKATNSTAAKAQPAAAMPGIFSGKSKYYLIAGVAMLALALGLIIRMVIRGRAYRPSLISTSMGGPPKR